LLERLRGILDWGFREWAIGIGLVMAIYGGGFAVLALLARLTGRLDAVRTAYLSVAPSLPVLIVGVLITVGIARHLGIGTAVRSQHRQLVVLLVGAAVLWTLRTIQVYANARFFSGLGLDFGLYYTQALMLAEDPTSLYDLGKMGFAIEVLRPFSMAAAGGVSASPVAYPPIFAALVRPFTLLGPVEAFLLWTAIGVALACYLAFRVGWLFTGSTRWVAAATVLVANPVILALHLGQPMVLLACAFGEMVLALRAGRGFRAGAWLAVLVLKPQYAILVGPLLLWKRCWRAVLGAALGVGLVLIASLAVAGVAGLQSYPQAVGGMSGFYGQALTFPAMMINWRSLLVTLLPFLPESLGVTLTTVLGFATVAVLAWTLRGQPLLGPGFLLRITAVGVATQLANYHNNPHGTAILAIPFAALFASSEPSRATRFWLLASVLIPYTVLLDSVLREIVLGGNPPLYWAPGAPLMLVGLLVSLLRDIRAPQAVVS
jgi:hypothetical protein